MQVGNVHLSSFQYFVFTMNLLKFCDIKFICHVVRDCFCFKLVIGQWVQCSSSSCCRWLCPAVSNGFHVNSRELERQNSFDGGSGTSCSWMKTEQLRWNAHVITTVRHVSVSLCWSNYYDGCWVVILWFWWCRWRQENGNSNCHQFEWSHYNWFVTNMQVI